MVNAPVNPSQIFADDVGRGMVNGVNGLGVRDEFESYIWPAWEFQLQQDIPHGSALIQYIGGDAAGDRYGLKNGDQFFIGEYAKVQANGKKRLTKDKVNRLTLMLGLASLYRLGAMGEIFYFTGVPIGDFKSQADRLKAMFEGEHVISYNGQQRKIKINRCGVLPESGAYKFLVNLGDIRILDPGAKTTNYITYRNGIYVDAESGTLDNGWETYAGKDQSRDVQYFANLIAGELGHVGWEEHDLIHIIGGRPQDLLRPLQLEGFSNIHLPPDNILKVIEKPGFANAYGYLKKALEVLGLTQQLEVLGLAA